MPLFCFYLKSKHKITSDDQASIKLQLQTHGVCVFGPFKDEKWIHETIQEMKGHLEGMPRLEEYKIKLDKTTNLTAQEVRQLRNLAYSEGEALEEVLGSLCNLWCSF
jgi:hypothetical protein